MKKFAVVAVAFVALTIIGCGLSAEQQKVMADLTSEVTNMISGTTSKLGEFDNIAGQITTAVTEAGDLAKKFPKDTTAIMGAVNQLNSAKDRLMGVKDNVNQWIAAYKEPDISKLKFDEVISTLKSSKDQLTDAGTQIEGAMSAATTALGSYKDIATGLMSKVAKK